MDSTLENQPVLTVKQTAQGFSSKADAPEADAPEAETTDLPSTMPDLKLELRIFVSTFITVFLAELGDKTQLTTLLMSAESQSPWMVFMGAGSALVATSLIGVLMGRWLSKRLPPGTLEVAAGILLLLIAVMLLWDVVHL